MNTNRQRDRIAMAIDSGKIAAHGKAMSRSQANAVSGGGWSGGNKPASSRSVEEIRKEEARVMAEAEAKKLPNGVYPKNLIKKLDDLRKERLANEQAQRNP